MTAVSSKQLAVRRRKFSFKNKVRTDDCWLLAANSGFSIIELLVVIAIFSFLAVIGTQIVTVSLRNTDKSERLIKVRENVDYSMSVMERKIRNAHAVDCTNSTNTELHFTDESSVPSIFYCVGNDTNGYLRLDSSQRLTGTDMVVLCASNQPFTCTQETETNPPSVTISVVGQDTTVTTGIGAAKVSASTQIILRSY